MLSLYLSWKSSPGKVGYRTLRLAPCCFWWLVVAQNFFPPAWKAALSPSFPGILFLLYHFLLLSCTFKKIVLQSCSKNLLSWYLNSNLFLEQDSAAANICCRAVCRACCINSCSITCYYLWWSHVALEQTQDTRMVLLAGSAAGHTLRKGKWFPRAFSYVSRTTVSGHICRASLQRRICLSGAEPLWSLDHWLGNGLVWTEHHWRWWDHEDCLGGWRPSNLALCYSRNVLLLFGS